MFLLTSGNLEGTSKKEKRIKKPTAHQRQGYISSLFVPLLRGQPTKKNHCSCSRRGLVY